MSDHDELGRTLRTLLLEEADAMDIDTRDATERLVRELRPRAPRRQMIVALVACAAVLAVLAWSIRDDDRRGVAPVDGLKSPSPATVSDAYYLDLGDGTRTSAPPGAAALVDTRADVAFSPTGDRVVYGTCLMGAGRCAADDELFLAGADGSDERLLTPPPGLNAYFPAWSPDGTKLVYQARQGGVADVGNLYLHDLVANRTTRLTDLDLVMPMWWLVTADFSPDGERVVYAVARTSDLQTTFDVWEVPVSGGEPTRLFENATSPQYLADGRIAFVQTGRLVAATPAGDPEVLLDFEPESAVTSSDGTEIAYLADGVVRLLDATTRRSETLVRAEKFAWVGDGRLLIIPGPGQ